MSRVRSGATGIDPVAGIAISILAGGLSARMGRDKARMRLSQSSLLGHVRKMADELGVSVRIIRRDLVSRCGPLGGIYTALKTSGAEAEIFLACDMPFVPVELLRQLVRRSNSGRRAVFTARAGVAGFPFLIPVRALDAVEARIRGRQWSLQALTRGLRAAKIVVPRPRERELFNVNTPEDWRESRAILERQTASQPLRGEIRRRILRKSPLSARRSKVKVRP